LVPPIINPFIQRRKEDFIPLGLMSLAAGLEQKHTVKIYFPTRRLFNANDYRVVAQQLLKLQPDIVGFSTWCISYPTSLLIAKAIKKANSKIPVIFGGPQASVLAPKTLQNFPQVDFVLTGEADYSFQRFVEEWKKEQPDFHSVPGLYYSDVNNQILHTPPGSPIENMDDLPLPAYHLFPRQKIIKLDVGRGCPFHCSYCSTNSFFSKKYRIKSASRVIHEMTTLYNKMKIRHFGFAHDMFTLNKKHVHELCTGLIQLQNQKGIQFKWTCSARIDCVDEKMLTEMQKAGCQAVFFGIESGSEKIQKAIHKNLKISKAYRIADWCRNSGLTMHASFISGFPEEETADVEKTLQSILKLAMRGVFVQISELSLLPGTSLYENHKTNLKFDYIFSGFSRTVCGPAELMLIKKHPEIFSSFYYLPVKSLNRQELIFLNHLVNKISNFRNTLFLLSPLLENEVNSGIILQLFKKEFKKIKANNELQAPAVSHLILFIEKYINQRKTQISFNYLQDVFAYESLYATLTSLYRGWKMFRDEQPTPDKINGDAFIKPAPFGKLLITRHKLETILPEENGWKSDGIRAQTGRYFYLLVAVSETKCKKIKLNESEFLMLKYFQESSYAETLEKFSCDLPKKKAQQWLKKLLRIGVLKIKNQPA
jgi:radical SAM superfamily enzyme YgiQ (UPF0313 family)